MGEAIGVVASIFILISFLMKEEIKIRTINIFGAGLFVIYGFIIGSFSNILLNSILILVHIYFIFQKKEDDT